MSQGHGGYKCSIKTDHTYFECAYFDEKTMTYPMNRIVTSCVSVSCVGHGRDLDLHHHMSLSFLMCSTI